MGDLQLFRQGWRQVRVVVTQVFFYVSRGFDSKTLKNHLYRRGYGSLFNLVERHLDDAYEPAFPPVESD